MPENPNECWLWTASTCGQGYGQFFVRKGRSENGKPRPFMALAHRVAYELTRGPIPEGLTIDHLCKNRLCVNAAHMEAVPIAENVRRATPWSSLKTHCPKGHPYDRTDSWVNKKTGKVQTGRRCNRCRKAQENARGW